MEVDVAVLQALQNIWSKGLKRIVMTYDIMCKYKVNLFSRASNNPWSPLAVEFMNRLKLGAPELVKKVNAFHGATHKPECRDEHSIRNTPHVGRMTGEDVESGWAKLNKEQWSSREMDAGGRRDDINTHMETSNYDKIQTMSKFPIILIPRKMLIISAASF